MAYTEPTPTERLESAIAECGEAIEIAHIYDHLVEGAERMMADPSILPDGR